MNSSFSLSLLSFSLATAPLLTGTELGACASDSNSVTQVKEAKSSLRLGVTYEVTRPGSQDLAARPKREWQSEIKIVGKLADGTIFLNRTEPGQLLTIYPGFNNFEEQFALTFFDELALIGVGGKITLHAPQGFGEYARGPVPAGADLIFDVELVSTRDVEAEEKHQQTKEDAWFADLLKSNPDLIATPSGICYQILDPGAERKAQRSDVCDIKLTATLADKTPLLTNESVRLYRNFYNSDHALVIKRISELALIGEAGKLRLYIPFNMGFRHYAKEGIPAYSALIYDVELCKTYSKEDQDKAKDKNAYLPKFYCVYEEYPMLLRQPQERGNATCSWAFACTNTTSIGISKNLIDLGLTPPSIRTPIVRKEQVVGYEQPGPQSLEGLLSAQMLISLMQEKDKPAYGSRNIYEALNTMTDNYVICTKFAPYQSPESPESIAPAAETYISASATNTRTAPGGYSTRICLEDYYDTSSPCPKLYNGDAVIAAITNWDSAEFLEHCFGVMKAPDREDLTNEDSEHLFVSLVGWGEDADGRYFIVEDSSYPKYFHDEKGPFCVENFSRNLTKISAKNKFFFKSFFACMPRVLEADGTKRKLDYDLDVYKDRYQDGYLPWPYLRP